MEGTGRMVPATLLLTFLLSVSSGPVHGAVGAELPHQSAIQHEQSLADHHRTLPGQQLPDDVLKRLIGLEVDLMAENLSNLTALVTELPYTPSGLETTAADAGRSAAQEGIRLVPPTTLRLLPLPGESVGAVLPADEYVSAIQAAAGAGLRTLTLDTDDGDDSAPSVPCDLKLVRTTLVNSSKSLDKVTYQVFTAGTLKSLSDQNDKLNSFQTDCTFQFNTAEEKTSLLNMIGAVQKHTGPAKSAVTPDDGDGVPLSSAYMLLMITLSVVMGVLLLSALAIFAYMHVQGSSHWARQRKPPGRIAAAGAPVSGQRNPAYQMDAERPARSLHETENWRWTRQGDAELHDGDDDPVTTRTAKKSTWGRIWGGVVKDYQQHSPAAREPHPQLMPRPQTRAISGYGANPAAGGPSAPARSGADRRVQPSRYPDRESCDREPAAGRSARRDDSPPVHRASPSADSSDNWAYRASGRNRSTDSPFTSAW